jgi:putative mRNA 3-end processing factor
MSDASPEKWMQVRPEGLYCEPADAFIDPHTAVPRAIVTHGHADHARSGHHTVYATPETIAIMRTRYSDDSVAGAVELTYGERLDLGNDVTLWLAPAGHILGSAQAVLEHAGRRVVVSGDYKRHRDPTCTSFEVVKCDVFVTEATFALPVFSHPPIEHEMAKLMRSMDSLPERTHLVGVYALGKCQRIMISLREAGYTHPFYVHGALQSLIELYQGYGYEFGPWRAVSTIEPAERDLLRGKIVLCPPSALADRWSRRLPDPLPAMASGWMQIRARARQRRAEMALIVSDHADWNDLLRTARDTGASDIWITHGRVEALQHALELEGIRAKALNLVGREDETD